MENEIHGHHILLSWWQVILLAVIVIVIIHRLHKIRFRQKGVTDEMMRAWHDDPTNWKAGVFYFNPQDPRLMPPKRFASLGWTINFANPLSIVFVIGFIFFVLMFVGCFS